MSDGWIIIYYQLRESTHSRPTFRHLCWAGLGYKIYFGCRPRSVAYRHAIDIVRGVRGGKVVGSNRLWCATYWMCSVGESGSSVLGPSSVPFTKARPQAERRRMRCKTSIRSLHKGEAAGRASWSQVSGQHPLRSQGRGRRPSVVVCVIVP